MRLLPRSLSGRLLVTSVAAIVVALTIAGLAIGHVLGRFVLEGLDRQLDAQIAVVARAVRPDGSLDAGRIVDVPPFDEPGGDWTWQVTAPGGVLRSGSLRGRAMVAGRLPPPHRHEDAGEPRPFEALTPEGEPLHGRLLVLPTAAGPAELVAAGPRRIVERPLRAAAMPLLLSVGLLGIALALAVLVQLRLGLRPVERVRAMLADVRAGRRRRIDIDEPTELLPLVAELNALIEANEAGLARARLHVANLAHGLKTPLATLRLDLAEPGRDDDGRLTAQVLRLEDQVRHHLGRARAADPGASAVPSMPLAPVVAGLVVAMERLNAGRAIAARVTVPPALGVRCDPQDLDEALGNLLENAWRHARASVTVAATTAGRIATIAIGDDGEPLTDAALAELGRVSAPNDERRPGQGHGLRIARELIELHGGSLTFERGPPGGLLVTVRLPAS